VCAAHPIIRKNDKIVYCRKKGIGEKTVKITGPKNLIAMIQIALKLIIIQFLILHISTSYDYKKLKKLKANFKTYPGPDIGNSFGAIYRCGRQNIRLLNVAEPSKNSNLYQFPPNSILLPYKTQQHPTGCHGRWPSQQANQIYFLRAASQPGYSVIHASRATVAGILVKS